MDMYSYLPAKEDAAKKGYCKIESSRFVTMKLICTIPLGSHMARRHRRLVESAIDCTTVPGIPGTAQYERDEFAYQVIVYSLP